LIFTLRLIVSALLSSSFRRRPESSSCFLTSFPRKRESLLIFHEVQGFYSPCGRAGHFLYSGHPALRRVAASFAVRAAPAAQCLCKESNQRNTPPVARSPGILPSECASGLRGSLSAHPCARSELARILRATLRAFLRPLAAPQGAPFGRHPAAEATATARVSPASRQSITTT